MELESLKSYKSSFELLKWLTVVSVVASIALVAFGYSMFVSVGSNGYNSIWVVDYKTGDVMKGKRTGIVDINLDERQHEYKHHVEMFCENYYEFDEFTFKRNVERSLKLVGSYAENLRNKYIEGQVLRKVQENHLRIFATVDSVKFDASTKPVQGIFYVTQTIERANGMSVRRMASTFDVLDAQARTEDNPHGVILDNFKEVLNEVIEQ